METVTLNAKSRSVIGKRVRDLRDQSLIPAVIYGHGVEARNLAVEYLPFEKALAKAGESSLIDLAIDGAAPVKVMIKDVQLHPLSSRIIHVDLRQVKLTEKLEADIEFNFVGEAPALKVGGILVKSMDSISVRCLPTALVPSINVDLSVLKNIGDSIKTRDIVLPEGMESLDDPSAVVVVVNEPISEAELKELEAKPEMDVSAVKVESEEKKAKAEAEGEEKEEKATAKK